MRVPQSVFNKSLLVPDGANVADKGIDELAATGELVMNAYIPLAADTVDQGVAAWIHKTTITPTPTSVERHGGPSPFDPKHRQAFANKLERGLVRNELNPGL